MLKALKGSHFSQYVNWTEVDKYRGSGGVIFRPKPKFKPKPMSKSTIGPVYCRCCGFQVRIEDMFLVTENGVEKYSSVPRTVDEIEEFMEHHRKMSLNVEFDSEG